LGTRIAAIIADLIVLAVTWYKTVSIVREAHLLGIRVAIGEILFRDGELSSNNYQWKLEANRGIFVMNSTKRVGSLFFLWVHQNSRLYSLFDDVIIKGLCLVSMF
jgi:hypothetical protein